MNKAENVHTEVFDDFGFALRIPTKRPTQSAGRGPPVPREEAHLIQGNGPTHRSEATLAAWVTPRRS